MLYDQSSTFLKMKVTLAKLAFALLAAAASVEGEEVKKKSPVLRGAVQVVSVCVEPPSMHELVHI